MKSEEFHALKNQLEQLNMELKRFKKELLSTRIEELEQIVHSPLSKSCQRMPKVSITTKL